jgi:hypothetical protein
LVMVMGKKKFCPAKMRTCYSTRRGSELNLRKDTIRCTLYSSNPNTIILIRHDISTSWAMTAWRKVCWDVLCTFSSFSSMHLGLAVKSSDLGTTHLAMPIPINSSRNRTHRSHLNETTDQGATILPLKTNT